MYLKRKLGLERWLQEIFPAGWRLIFNRSGKYFQKGETWLGRDCKK